MWTAGSLSGNAGLPPASEPPALCEALGAAEGRVSARQTALLALPASLPRTRREGQSHSAARGRGGDPRCLPERLARRWVWAAAHASLAPRRPCADRHRALPQCLGLPAPGRRLRTGVLGRRIPPPAADRLPRPLARGSPAPSPFPHCRYGLDPFERHAEETLWRVLERTLTRDLAASGGCRGCPLPGARAPDPWPR